MILAVYPEKKGIGLGLYIYKVKSGTRNILRFLFALRTNVLRFL